ncbi:MAG: hypothetical protein WCA30_07830, partial [Dermatophilaceae bacterium]
MPGARTSPARTTQQPAAVRLVAMGVVGTLVLFIVAAVFGGIAQAETAPRLVWICKYVGSPADPRFQGVISASTSATDGTWFTDGQLPSKVIRELDEGENPGQAPESLAAECPQTPPGNGTETTPPVTETTPPVTETTPPVTETTPPVTETTPPVTETTPPVTETTPPVTETTPPVTETTPPSTSTTTPDTPGAAPTDLGPTQTTGILSLFAIAAGLLFGAARLLRGARH